MIEASLLSLFLLGLLGGAHCAGMCGGIIAALSAPSLASAQPVQWVRDIPALQPDAQDDAQVGAGSGTRVGSAPRARHGVLAAYHVGRLGAYTIAGALAGTAGALAWVLQRMLPVQQIAFVLTNLLLIAIGLHLMGVTRWVAWIERTGARGLGPMWRRLQAGGARVLRARTAAGGLAAGLLWGCVPCGLVYTGLVAALASGGPAQGAALMLAFGLGTLPNLLGLGWVAGRAQARIGGDDRWGHRLRMAAGLLVLGFAIAGLARLDPLAGLQGLAELCLTPLRAVMR